ENVRTLANALYNTAQLALFEFDAPNVLLIAKPTGGTAAAARQAAKEGLDAGAAIVLGPLFAEEVMAVAPLAREANAPVAASSSASPVGSNAVPVVSVALYGNGAGLADSATLQGHTRFAALSPQGSYGERGRAAFERAASQRAGRIVASTSYPSDPQAMYGPAKRIAGAYGGGNYTALFLPEGGPGVKAIAPLLPYYDVDPRVVKFLGTGAWDDVSLTREPPLHAGWYPAPPPASYQQFVARYQRAYGSTPPRIASLGYDAVSLAIALSGLPAGERYTTQTLTNEDGFAGVDGIFR